MLPPGHDRRALPDDLRMRAQAGHDGWPLRGFTWPGGARGSLLFQTGRGDFIEKYIEPLAHWHDQGWNVAGFDWRGQGGSARAATGVSLFDGMVADAAAYVTGWLAETPGPHVIVGHSMGGHILLRLLAEHAPAVDAAVLSAPMLGLAHGRLRPAMAAAIARTACAIGWRDRPLWRVRAGTPLARQANLTGSDERYADELWWRAARPDFDLGPPDWGWLAGAFASMARLDRPGVLEGVTVPLLIVATERDRLVSAAAIRRAAARLANARLMMFDGAHELLRERDPARQATMAAIDGFLDAKAGPR